MRRYLGYVSILREGERLLGGLTRLVTMRLLDTTG